MKKTILTLTGILLIGITLFAFIGKEKYKTLAIGDKAPKTGLKMTSTAGQSLTLKGLNQENGLLVIFSCNTCPFVIAWEDRYPEIAELAAKNNIGFVLVNSNEARRDGDDSMEEMQKHAKEKGYPSLNYVIDKNSELANAFGAKTTPHVFLFNNNMELVYEGAIDDSHKKEKVEKTYLKDAINNLSGDKKIDPANTKAVGCSIKRVKS